MMTTSNNFLSDLADSSLMRLIEPLHLRLEAQWILLCSVLLNFDSHHDDMTAGGP